MVEVDAVMGIISKKIDLASHIDTLLQPRPIIFHCNCPPPCEDNGGPSDCNFGGRTLGTVSIEPAESYQVSQGRPAQIGILSKAIDLVSHVDSLVRVKDINCYCNYTPPCAENGRSSDRIFGDRNVGSVSTEPSLIKRLKDQFFQIET